MADQVRAGVVFKAAGDANIQELDLTAFDAIVTVVPSLLEPVGVDASVKTLDQVGLGDRGALVNQVSERAVSYAQERGAELVGKRRLSDGRIVDNPDAEWRIDEDTRTHIRNIIDKGLKDNVGRDEIADEIERSFWFSPERAEMIANTEIAMANSQATLDTFHEARAAGVKLGKSWQADNEACEECLSNEAAGIIDIDDVFPTGDDAPPAHPWCECVLVPEVQEEAADDVEAPQDKGVVEP